MPMANKEQTAKRPSGERLGTMTHHPIVTHGLDCESSEVSRCLRHLGLWIAAVARLRISRALCGVHLLASQAVHCQVLDTYFGDERGLSVRLQQSLRDPKHCPG